MRVASSDPGVATASANGAAVTISGVAVGRASVAVTSADGRSATLEVQVYDPRRMEAGELSIAFTTEFSPVFVSSASSWEVGSWSAWQPVPPAGYHTLGDFGMPFPGPVLPGRTTTYWDPNGVRAAMVVKGNTPTALALTGDYQLVGTTESLYWDQTGVIWRPLCPGGYRSLGMVMTWERPLPATPTPPGHPTACVRQDLTTPGRVGADKFVYVGAGYEGGSLWYQAVWAIDQPVVGSHPRAYLAPGTFVWSKANVSSDSLLPPPSADPAVNILDVDLQLLGEAPPQAVFPKLSHDPAPETAPLFTKAVLVPCSVVKDPVHDATWQIANSPFYRLERSVSWRLIAHDYNATSVEQPNSVQFTMGITTEESQRIWEATNVSVSTEVGLEIGFDAGPLSAGASTKVTVSLNEEMGYETAHSLAELRSRTDTLALQTPARTSVALWQQVSRFTLYRHNGSRLEVVEFWEAGTSTFYADELPMD